MTSPIDIFTGKKTFITGHTGFKGSWLTLWLSLIGSHVYGYSLPAAAESHYNIVGIKEYLHDELLADIRDRDILKKVLMEFRPDVIFHFAAQPLVTYGYLNPRETHDVNIMGTIALLEAIRENGQPVIVIIVTSDKCYAVEGRTSCFQESDRLGGSDPYSASKAAVEIICESYRCSYFTPEKLNEHQIALATVRAGNVIGGGDFASDRIIPDMFRSIVAKEPIILRNPQAIRPWQHVLEPLYGYLLLASTLLTTREETFCSAFNFGPDSNDCLTVQELIDRFIGAWPEKCAKPVVKSSDFHETPVLNLSVEKSRDILGWSPLWKNQQAIEKTANWYYDYLYNGNLVSSRSIQDIIEYMDLVK
ncbi:CDP-glucose 4,6-dehydratase [Methanospirillum lacunae]|uniref:CDP-glucose 4,6-dehydratase n=1 Tax=Methanospirillum lacunae TaxID=668570 RepID=UPI0015E836C4|nr:CDP-glucose 4,6-dehydratase [Methanospirillum lacunae]